MPSMRTGVPSLLESILRITAFTLALCVGRGLALETQAPQTPQQTQARDLLNQGVEAFKHGQADEAARLFEQAKNLDPHLLNARLYLATTNASQFIPGAPSEENRRYGQRAIDEFQSVLQIDAQNLSAIDGLGALLFQMAGTPPVDPDLFKESKQFHLKHIQLKPDDPEPYYWIGVIDWTLAFRANGLYRAKYNLESQHGELGDSDPLAAEVGSEYAREYEPVIEEGIQNLQQAIRLRPEYDDAMAYLNLMYRRKADIVETRAQREELTKMADDLVERVKEIKQQRAQVQPPQP